MKHRSCQILYEHWQDQRGDRLLPERSEIDPARLRSALGDTFILSFNSLKEHPFRLAGTRVCALFGRELRETPFLAPWDSAAREEIAGLMRAAADDSVAVIAGVCGRAEDGATLDLELLLLPLKHCGQTHLRMIGAMAPLLPPHWLGLRRLVALSVTEHRFIGHSATILGPALAPAAPPRLRRGLVVYDGGQG